MLMPFVALLSLISEPDRLCCWSFLDEHKELLKKAQGSSNNHQAWPGGYVDHVQEVMSIAAALYPVMNRLRPLPFSLSDALVVLFLHDSEKPFKEQESLFTKEQRQKKREQLIDIHGFKLTFEQLNALRYVEGEGDSYSNKHRVMNEMAAFCHMCDVASARIWHDQPKQKGC